MGNRAELVPIVSRAASHEDGDGLHRTCFQHFQQGDALVSCDDLHGMYVAPDSQRMTRSIGHEFVA